MKKPSEPPAQPAHYPLPLKIQPVGHHNGSELWMLIDRFRAITSFGNIEIPIAFVSDGASIPRPFWSLLGPTGPYFADAVVHDYLYSEHNDRFSRWESDQIFKELMYNSGIGWLKRETIYRAVRMFGWASFKGTETDMP